MLKIDEVVLVAIDLPVAWVNSLVFARERAPAIRITSPTPPQTMMLMYVVT